jgi:predicted DNA-binding transcriptional regulator YafY
MPDNRQAQLRYQVIDRCLSNRGRQWTWQDILEEVNYALKVDNPESKGVSKTTFYEDIKDIEYRIYKSDIERIAVGNKERTVYYRYSDPSYSINNQPLSEAETSQLKSAIQVLSRFKGMPQFEWVNEIIPTLETKLGFVGSEKPIISFEDNIDYSGLAYITPIFNAILNRRVLKVSYQHFKSPEPYDVIFHPYHLKQYNNRWFVFGLNPEFENQIWNLALDRIKVIQEVSNAYILSEMDWDEYFYDFIGVSKQNEAELTEVKLLFSFDTAPYIETKPIHPTQKHKRIDSGLKVSIKVIPNYELEKLILSFGESVKVLYPESLSQKIKQKLEKAFLAYSKTATGR